MNKYKLGGVSLIAGVVMALSPVTPALAWHPEGQIEKYVQNQTTGTDLGEYAEAAPGDEIRYVIEVSNTAKDHSKGYNDMYYTVMKDELPEGVELVNDPSTRIIEEDIGVVKPKETVSFEYTVTVTSEIDGAEIVNEACFEGDSEVYDRPQQGCDDATIKVVVPEVPEVPEQPEPEPEPEQPKGGAGGGEPKVLPAKLPETGAASLISAFSTVTGLSYAAHHYITRKRQ